MTKILVTASEAAEMLSLSPQEVYNLAADGKFDKRYVGKGTRNFRITVESIQRYADGLSPDPIEATA